MAAEHVLIPKTKYELLCKNATSTQSDNATNSTSIQSNNSTIPSNGSQPKQLPPLMDYCSDDDRIPDDDSTGNPDYKYDDILQGFNSVKFKYVQPILALMVENPDVLPWNENTGEIIFKNNTVKDSNVIELLKDTLTDNLHPVGKMEFYRGLVDINVKNRYIKHPKNKALLIAFIDKNRKVSNKRKVKRLKPNETKEWIVWK